MYVYVRESLLLIPFFFLYPQPLLTYNAFLRLSHHQLRHRHYCPPPESLVQHTRIKQYATRFPTTTTCLHTTQLAKQCHLNPNPKTLNSKTLKSPPTSNTLPCNSKLPTFRNLLPDRNPQVLSLSSSYPDDDDVALRLWRRGKHRKQSERREGGREW